MLALHCGDQSQNNVNITFDSNSLAFDNHAQYGAVAAIAVGEITAGASSSDCLCSGLEEGVRFRDCGRDVVVCVCAMQDTGVIVFKGNTTLARNRASFKGMGAYGGVAGNYTRFLYFLC